LHENYLYLKGHYEYYVEPILKRIYEVFGLLSKETKTTCNLTKVKGDGDYDYKVIIELPNHRKCEITGDLKPFVEGDTLLRNLGFKESPEDKHKQFGLLYFCGHGHGLVYVHDLAACSTRPL
jgi:hypothetical protein